MSSDYAIPQGALDGQISEGMQAELEHELRRLAEVDMSRWREIDALAQLDDSDWELVSALMGALRPPSGPEPGGRLAERRQ